MLTRKNSLRSADNQSAVEESDVFRLFRWIRSGKYDSKALKVLSMPEFSTDADVAMGANNPRFVKSPFSLGNALDNTARGGEYCRTWLVDQARRWWIIQGTSLRRPASIVDRRRKSELLTRASNEDGFRGWPVSICG